MSHGGRQSWDIAGGKWWASSCGMWRYIRVAGRNGCLAFFSKAFAYSFLKRFLVYTGLCSQ